jgi:alpha-beta hydrolase superfamily lysophospholipase
MNPGTRTAVDGTTLATQRWTTSSPRAAVVLVHGLAEHIGRYDHVATQLATRGFDVRGSDLRGFGRSGGERAYVEDFDQYTSDLVGDVTSAADLGVPVVLLGHSLGGLVAALYAAGDHLQPDLLVLSAPVIEAKVPMMKVLVARSLVRWFPKLEVSNGLKGEQLSSDPAVGERYFADPLVYPKSTLRLGVAFMEAMKRCRGQLDRITQPTLVIHSGSDTIVDPKFSERLGGIPGSTRIVFDGLRHESFNEDGGSLAIATVSDWIEAQL